MDNQTKGQVLHGVWTLFDIINEESAFELYKCIAKTAASNHVLLLMASMGGDAAITACLIQSILRKYPVFETRAVGEVASAAVDLLLAGSLRTAMEPAVFFTHSAADCREVKPHSAASHAKVLKHCDKWMFQLYADRTKRKDPDFWVDFFSKDRFFTAIEARRLGIIHEIL
jgi:ATP-dependent protease ClpP protease subunit